ncbi:HIT family protein [Candidatus Woesearchaeota archaeon]|nr:HIT family protein [Candidatus Woesearchaeota archaeon]
MTDCIFCKIVEGELPSFKVYEDNLVKAFLDQGSASPGHLLVVPRQHHENIFDIPEETLKQLATISKKMSLLVKERLGATGVNVLNASGKSAQQSVMHFHFHIVPRFDDDGLDLWFHGNPSEKSVLEEVYRKLV